MKLKEECSYMRIYKYTSLNSAISILKSGGVVLNNPKNFNDPNDSSFVQSEKDKRKIEKLENDYFIFKVFDELVSLNKITLNKKSRAILNGLQKEMKAMNWFLKKRPYFDRIYGFNLITKVIEAREPQVELRLNEEKAKFQTKIDNAIATTKDNALVSCFSKRNNSILMWSHYANSHRGVCIEYERPESDEFKDVVYSKKRPFSKIYKAVSHGIGLEILGQKTELEDLEEDLEETLKPFFIKSQDWTYEKEVRCLYSKSKHNDNVKRVDNKYILDIGIPKRIYIGCNASGEELDLLIEMAERRDIDVVFMKKSEKTFDIIEDRDYKYVPGVRKREKEITLTHIVKEINKCLDLRMPLAAFFSSLIIPGICSQVECPKITDVKQRYIEWCDIYLPCTDKSPQKDNMPVLSGELLWNLKEKLYSEGNINFLKDRNDTPLKHLLLRTEKRRPFDIYCDVISQDSITLNITKFCHDMVYQAERCYELNKEEVDKLPQIPLQDFDALLDKLNEQQAETDALRRRLRIESKAPPKLDSTIA